MLIRKHYMKRKLTVKNVLQHCIIIQFTMSATLAWRNAAQYRGGNQCKKIPQFDVAHFLLYTLEGSTGAAAVGSAFVLDLSSSILRGEREKITFMQGPAYSPDLTPIENLWDALGRAVCTDMSTPYLILTRYLA